MELLQPGIYQNISETDYHALPYLGSSTLKRFAKNPFESTQPFVPSAITQKTMDTGSGLHKLALEGRQAYEAAFVVAPACDKRTNGGKVAWEQFLASACGRTVLDSEQGLAVEGMAASLKEHPASSIMLNRGANEVTVIWSDQETGIMCKARPDDWFNGVAMDLKSTSDVSKFKWTIRDFRYDLQAAHYTEGLITNGETVEGFVFIAVQSNKTYPVRVGMLNQDAQDTAVSEWRRQMNLFKQCSDNGFPWPNYSIPSHVFDVNDITPNDLMEEF